MEYDAGQWDYFTDNYRSGANHNVGFSRKSDTDTIAWKHLAQNQIRYQAYTAPIRFHRKALRDIAQGFFFFKKHMVAYSAHGFFIFVTFYCY